MSIRTDKTDIFTAIKNDNLVFTVDNVTDDVTCPKQRE